MKLTFFFAHTCRTMLSPSCPKKSLPLSLKFRMVPGEKHDSEQHTDLCNKEQAEYHLCVGMMIYIYLFIINLDNSIYIYIHPHT